MSKITRDALSQPKADLTDALRAALRKGARELRAMAVEAALADHEGYGDTTR